MSNDDDEYVPARARRPPQRQGATLFLDDSEEGRKRSRKSKRGSSRQSKSEPRRLSKVDRAKEREEAIKRADERRKRYQRRGSVNRRTEEGEVDPNSFNPDGSKKART